MKDKNGWNDLEVGIDTVLRLGKAPVQLPLGGSDLPGRGRFQAVSDKDVSTLFTIFTIFTTFTIKFLVKMVIYDDEDVIRPGGHG